MENSVTKRVSSPKCAFNIQSIGNLWLCFVSFFCDQSASYILLVSLSETTGDLDISTWREKAIVFVWFPREQHNSFLTVLHLGLAGGSKYVTSFKRILRKPIGKVKRSGYHMYDVKISDCICLNSLSRSVEGSITVKKKSIIQGREIWALFLFLSDLHLGMGGISE